MLLYHLWHLAQSSAQGRPQQTLGKVDRVIALLVVIETVASFRIHAFQQMG